MANRHLVTAGLADVERFLADPRTQARLREASALLAGSEVAKSLDKADALLARVPAITPSVDLLAGLTTAPLGARTTAIRPTVGGIHR